MYEYKNPTFSQEDFVGQKKSNAKKYEKETLNSNYIQKEKVYFVFLDVLGFKDVFTNKKNESNSKVVNTFEEVFSHYFQLIDASSFSVHGDYYAGQTSDSLYFYTMSMEILTDFLKIFLYFNIYSMKKGVFFRGGISTDSLYYHQNKRHQFFGKSVVKAYLIESEIAEHPIVILDEATASDLEKHDRKLYKNIILKKEERNILNPYSYFNRKFTLPLDDQSIIKKVSEKEILTVIQDNERNNEFNPKIFKKYYYLKDVYSEHTMNKIGGNDSEK